MAKVEPQEQGHEQGGAPPTSNITLLPDHMIGEFLDRSHDDDLLALLSACKTSSACSRSAISRE